MMATVSLCQQLNTEFLIQHVEEFNPCGYLCIQTGLIILDTFKSSQFSKSNNFHAK